MIIVAATTVITTTTATANMLRMLNVKTSDAGNDRANWSCLKVIQKLSEPSYL
jgi:hypothetical protein